VLSDTCFENYLKKLYIFVRLFDVCFVLFMRHIVTHNLSYG